MATRFLVLCFALSSSFASPVTEIKNRQDCDATLNTAGATARFPGIVAHGIHSLTVEQLRKFKPDVTEKNAIPTINSDLTSNQPILFHAPNEPDLGDSFKTDSMRALDQVLSHMDNQYYDIGRYGTLERLVHSLHMREVWHEAQIPYQQLKQQPPSTDVCKCALDVDNNGIVKILRLIALQIREPELMLGKHVTKNGTVAYQGIQIYSYGFFTKEAAETPLENKGDPFPPITSQATWSNWKKVSMSMGQASDSFELALYLYCALNN